MNERQRNGWCVALVGLLLVRFMGPVWAGLARPESASVTQPGPASSPATVTNIAGIMQLSREVAAQGIPVDVSGVVTCIYAGDEAFFIHDGRAGVYVSNVQPWRHFGFGQRVRVRGKSFQGSFCPMITALEIQPLGTGTLPLPRPAAFALLASGSADSQWLEIRGVVQAVTYWPSRQGVSFDLAMRGGSLQVLVEYPNPQRLDSLIDAEVRVRGVASGSFNKKGQMVAPVFRVANISLVRVERPATTNWSELPLKPMNQLLLFSPHDSLPHRVRVRGTVTGFQPGQSVYLSQGQDSLKVLTAQPADYQPGDILEAAGFPIMSPYSAELRNAVCQRIDRGAPPPPTPASVESVLGGLHDAQLIRLRARLLDWVVDDTGITLALQSERSLFKGYLRRNQAPASWGIERNSLVDITGVCDIRDLERDVWYFQPRSFVLMLRSAADLAVVQKPPWLNAARLWRVVSLLSGLLVAAALWVWALRKEVSRKRALIEQQAKQVAVMEERTRIARDLHDTLEQGLVGLGLQLKAVEGAPADNPPLARTRLQLARRMLGNTRALTHYAVRELREGPGAEERLGEGLQRTAEFWNRTGALNVHLHLEEAVAAWPKTLEQPLLAIAREAMTNAVKHGQATEIKVGLRLVEGAAQLSVQDNGNGFETNSGDGEPGHFGLQGMRERLKSIGGTLKIESRPGRGTELLVSARLAGGAPVKIPAQGARPPRESSAVVPGTDSP